MKKNPSNRSSEQNTTVKRTGKRKGGRVYPLLCRLMGTVMLAAVIAACMPIAIPKVLGWSVYRVESESMEPELPVDSLIFVTPEDPTSLAAKDIITYEDGDVVVTHRVVENRVLEGTIITKGDANPENDRNPVTYPQVVGKVKYHSLELGGIYGIMSSTMGRIYAVMFAACGVMFHLLAGTMRREE